MHTMKTLVIASSNSGKLREFESLFAPLGIELVAQSKLGIEEAAEPHGSFVENALAKARHAALRSRLPALADDSGLCVRALNGEPGVHSARYAGEAPEGSARAEQDRRNNEKLIRALREASDRSAHFYCVIVLMRNGEDPEPLIAEGSWQGTIIEEARGENGFGYDPHFFLPDMGKTAAELGDAQKNLLSHRGKALRRLIAKIKEGV